MWEGTAAVFSQCSLLITVINLIKECNKTIISYLCFAQTIHPFSLSSLGSLGCLSRSHQSGREAGYTLQGTPLYHKANAER